MADTRFESDTPQIFDCGLDFNHGKLNFVHDIPTDFAYLSVKFD